VLFAGIEALAASTPMDLPNVTIKRRTTAESSFDPNFWTLEMEVSVNGLKLLTICIHEPYLVPDNVWQAIINGQETQQEPDYSRIVVTDGGETYVFGADSVTGTGNCLSVSASLPRSIVAPELAKALNLDPPEIEGGAVKGCS